MGKFNRNDIAIALVTDGTMLVAQGGPAWRELDKREDIVAVEFDLFFSQLKHRAAWRHPETGVLAIGYPSDAPKGPCWMNYCTRGLEAGRVIETGAV